MLPVFADSVRPTVELGGSVCGRLQHPLVDEDDPETRHPPFFVGMVRANEGYFPFGEKKSEKTVL